MRTLARILCACCLLLATPTWAQKLSNEGGSAVDLANERIIRKLYDDFVVLWNRHDAGAMSEMWAIDGDHLEPDGTRAKGRPAVTKLFMKQHTSVFKNSILKLTVDDVWFVTGDFALVDGAYDLSGVVAPDGTPIPDRKGHLTALLTHEGGDKWRIAASRLMIPVGLPYKKE